MSCNLSPKETIFLKCQILFSVKNKKNITSLSSADIAQRVLKVNMFCLEGSIRSKEQSNISKHYENTPIKRYRKFHLQKLKIFRIKKFDIFHISAQNISCGYLLELSWRGGINEYPQSLFLCF